MAYNCRLTNLPEGCGYSKEVPIIGTAQRPWAVLQIQ